MSTVAVYDLRKLSTLCCSPNLCSASPATVRLCTTACSSTIAAPRAASGPFVRRSDVDAWWGGGDATSTATPISNPVTAKAPQNRAARRMAEEMNLQLTRPTLKSAG